MSTYADSGQSFEFFTNISLYTFDVLLRCAMSYENDVQLKGYVVCVCVCVFMGMCVSMYVWVSMGMCACEGVRVCLFIQHL